MNRLLMLTMAAMAFAGLGFTGGFLLFRAPEPVRPTTDIFARCAVVATEDISGDTLRIRCGLDKTGIDGILHDALAGLGIQDLRSDEDPDTEAMQLAADRLGLSMEAVMALLRSLKVPKESSGLAGVTEPPIRAAIEVGLEDLDPPAADEPKGLEKTDDILPDRVALTVKPKSSVPEQEARTIAGECAAAAGGTVTLASIDIDCGPDKEEIQDLISQFVENAGIPGIFGAIKRDAEARSRLVTELGNALHLSDETVEALIGELEEVEATEDELRARLSDTIRERITLSLLLFKIGKTADFLHGKQSGTAQAIVDGKLDTARAVLRETGETIRLLAAELAPEQPPPSAQLAPEAESHGVQSPPAELPEEVQQIPEEIAPKAIPNVTRFVAQVRSGDVVDGPVEWTIIHQETEKVILAESETDALEQELDDGRYGIYARTDHLIGETIAEVTSGGANEIVVLLTQSEANATLAAPGLVTAGEPMEFTWRGPNALGDLIFIASAGMADNRYPADDRRHHKAVNGSPARLVAPAQQGTYEVRYYSFANGAVLARSLLEVGPPEVTLKPPEVIVAGEEVDVSWSGPAAPGDFLFIAPMDWSTDAYPTDSKYYHPAERGTPARLLAAPGEPGTYELRYYSRANGAALARVQVEIRLPEASVAVPPPAPAGSMVEVPFEGPMLKDDLLFVAPVDQAKNTYPLSDKVRYDAVAGSPAKLVLPPEPGVYEVRYFNPTTGLLARAPIEVTEPEVSFEAPRVVHAGTEMEVIVRGPNAPGDIVFIAPRDWKDNQYPIGGRRTHAVADGERAGFTAPAEAEVYELRYFSWPNGRKLASRALVVR